MSNKMKNSLIFRFEKELDLLAIDRGRKILVAVSGGLDSMVLATLCNATHLNFDIAHVNYGLRGEDSDKDEELVRKFANERGIPFHLKTAHVRVSKKSGSIQDEARTVRYRWFSELKMEHNFGYVFTAHHSDDEQETFIMNAIRGSGLSGLSSIPKRNNSIIRPLLGFKRSELEAFAETNGVEWREDISNRSLDYLRNRIRKEVLPRLWDIDPRAQENITKSIQWLKQADEFFVDYAAQYCSSFEMKNQFEISDSDWNALFRKKPIHKYIFERLGFDPGTLTDLEKFTSSQSGKQIVGKNYRVYRDRNRFVFEKLDSASEGDHVFLEPSTGSISVPLSLSWNVFDLNVDIPLSPKKAVLDTHKLVFPLKVRKWEHSDRFMPLGLGGSKLVSDFLTDIKLSVPEKKNVWVLVSEGEIAWIIGYRIDDRFKITPQTTNATIFETE
jgi:tRNA(Ile)-lysidine synthase